MKCFLYKKKIITNEMEDEATTIEQNASHVEF